MKMRLVAKQRWMLLQILWSYTYKPKTAYFVQKYHFNYIINKLYKWIKAVCMLG